MTKISMFAALCAFLITSNACFAATPRDAYQKGVDCIASDNLMQAIAFFSEELEKNPRNVQALLHRSQAYALTNQFGRAISDCDAALNINPKNGEAYFQRGLYRGFSTASGSELFALSAARFDLQKAAKFTTDRQRLAEVSELLSYNQTESASQQREIAGLVTSYDAALRSLDEAQ